MTDSNYDAFSSFLQEQGFEVEPEFSINEPVDDTKELPTVRATVGESDFSPVEDPRPNTDVMMSASMRVNALMSQLADPFDTHIWDNKLTDFQSQLRTCLGNEIIARFIHANHQTYDVFDDKMSDDEMIFALMFPITIGFLLHNDTVGRDIDPADNSMMVTTLEFGDMTIGDLIGADEHRYTCEMVHAPLKNVMDEVPAKQMWDVLQESQQADALCAGYEIFRRWYVSGMKHYFKPNLKVRQIVSMCCNVTAAAMRFVRVMEAVFDETD